MFHRNFFKRRQSNHGPAEDQSTPSTSKASHENRTSSVESSHTLTNDPEGPASSENAASHFKDQGPHSRTPSDASVSIPSENLPYRPTLRAPGRSADPLGLSLIYTSQSEPVADIIFVHGLGGSSRLSWCMGHDINLYWPVRWLPTDPDVQQTRIFTFGYNADFRSSTQSMNLGISDFSKTLLYDMVYGRGQTGENFDLGRRPIVFVTHSMGGLVFKKAYLDAQLDDTYSVLSRSIRAVIFLATPHQGADLSEFLNKLLSVSFRHSPKQYVSELSKNGPFLKSVNEQFRHIATRLRIFSFYETLQTSVGLSSTMILDEDSAKLGYPDEISRPLNADHHGVCKYDTSENPNYKAVLGGLKSLVTSYMDKNTHTPDVELQLIRTLLTIPENPDHDLNYFSGRRADGTSEWILEQPLVRAWASSPSRPEVLWVHGRPARGKSILSSFIINHLSERGAAVQHFYFRSGDETKRSIGSLLRLLAFQLSVQFPPFRKALAKLAEGGYKPKDSDWKSIWKKLYVGLLFKLDLCTPIYWVIDALDESNASQQVLELLGDIQYSVTPIHVLVTSRFNPSLSSSFGRISSMLHCSMISIDKDRTDMEIYIDDELQYLGWDSSVKEEVRMKILDQANDNFLWVHLILEEIKECNTDDDVRAALTELPAGMESLYQRMESSIARIRRPSDKSLSRQLFLWTIYTRRAVSIDELRSLLKEEFGHILDMVATINRLCGHFIVVEGNHRVGLIHQTAREYLASTRNLPFSLDAADAHDELFRRSLSVFMDKGLRSQLSITGVKLFQYRATFWAYHMRVLGSSGDSDSQLDTLIRFFSENSFLTWVQVLASLGQLNVLIETSHSLSSFVKRKRRTDNARDPFLRRFGDLELLDLWSRDLLKLPARFGSSLSLEPHSVYSCVAPMCPRGSAIHKTFGTNSALKVKGLSEDWDDCLARVFVGNEHPASLLCCSGRYLVVVDNMGTIFVWDCTTFHLMQTLSHGEIVSAVIFNASGDRIATYGTHRTKVWDPQSGLTVFTIENPPDMRALFIEFVDDDTRLMIGSDRRRVLYAILTGSDICWNIFDESLLNDIDSLEGTYLNAPIALALSPDHSRIAAAYRRFPLTIWSLNPPKVLTRVNRGQASTASPFVKKVAWHPSSEELIGLFLDGYSFKLNIVDGTYQELPPDQGQWPSDIWISPDGAVFAIAGVHGSIKLYDYQTSALIYQMTSEDMTAAFCFSQDSRRFYDIRQNSCSIWEPNALLRLLATEEHPTSSQAPEESVEQSNNVSESFADNPIPVTLLSPRSEGPIVLMADDDGLIELLNYETGYSVQIDQIGTGLGVEQLIWSEDNHHLAYAEVGGRLTIVHVEPTPTGWKKRRLARFKAKHQSGGINQLLLSPDAESLLVVFSQIVQLWSIQGPTLLASKEHNSTVGSARWSIHPQSESHLLSITPTRCVVHRWTDLAEIATWDIHTDVTQSGEESPRGQPDYGQPNAENILRAVENITITHFRTHLIVTIGRKTPYSRLRPEFFLVSGNIGLSTGDGAAKLEVVSMPSGVMEQIDTPLNVLKNDRLVYLDKSLGICTWNLRAGNGDVTGKRHYFIPRDWVSMQNIGLFHVTSSGSLLFPLKKEIAVISSTIGSEW